METKNISAEKSLIGACLILGQIPPGIDLKPNDFYREFHARVWYAILSMQEKNQIIDVISLHKQLVRTGVNMLPSFMTETVVSAWPIEDPSYELGSIEEYARQYQLQIKNAEFERSKKILKEKIITFVMHDEFPAAIRALDALLGFDKDIQPEEEQNDK